MKLDEFLDDLEARARAVLKHVDRRVSITFEEVEELELRIGNDVYVTERSTKIEAPYLLVLIRGVRHKIARAVALKLSQ